jgi:hypothetical protein
MIKDCEHREHRSSFKSLHRASIVSSLFESTTKKIHPLEPGVEIEIESPDTPERRSIYDSRQTTHMGRAAHGRGSDLKRGIHSKR